MRSVWKNGARLGSERGGGRDRGKRMSITVSFGVQCVRERWGICEVVILTGRVEAELAGAEGAAEEVRRRVARAREDVHG